MKKYLSYIAAVILLGNFAGCRKYLDVNSDPSTSQNPDPAAVLPSQISYMARNIQFDGRFIGNLTQMWHTPATADNYDVHGGNFGSTTQGHAIWRMVYFEMGDNLNYIIKRGTNDQLWDYVGVAEALKAWSFLTAADHFGDIVFRQAFEPNRTVFNYDEQELVYKGVDSIARRALEFLSRTDGKVNAGNLARGDLAYQGNRDKWIRFTYGLLARIWHHQSNKSDYNADSVIRYVDLAMQSNADNFMCPHSATKNDDTNVWGPARDNLSVKRQSRFIVQLLDGTTYTGNSNPQNRDPRLRLMLSVSPDTATLVNNSYTALNGGYRYLIPATSGNADPNHTAAPTTVTGRRRVSTLYGDSAIINTGVGNWSGTLGKYVFQNRVSFPIMTYHELQFIKSEAAFRKGDRVMAHTAYLNGIRSHMDFVNTINSGVVGVPNITTAQRDAYLASGNVRQIPDSLRITDIMLQKYIGDYGWNFEECWMDLRRFHYFDIDPLTGNPVYIDFARGIPFYSANNLGPKPQYRFFPHPFSENDWNINELRRIGGLNIDYHTYETWVTKP